MAGYRVGVIGLGRIASTIDDEVQGYSSVMLPYSHTACYREVPEVELVAAADVLPEKRHAYAQRWGLDNLYADHERMLQQEKLDIVSVCTRTQDRPAVIHAAIDAGVRVIFAEKPLCASLAEADAIVTAAEEKGITIAVGCTRRWNPHFQTARRLADEGAIGKVLQVDGYGSAFISHNGSHMLDTIRFLAGDRQVEWVFGEADPERAATDEDLPANGYLAFSDGVRAFTRMMPCGAANWEFDIIGETGRIRSVYNSSEWEYWTLQGEGRRPEIVRHIFPQPQRCSSPGVNAVRDLVAALETGKKPACSVTDARAALETAIALRESQRTGARVSLPLADRSLRIIPHA